MSDTNPLKKGDRLLLQLHSSEIYKGTVQRVCEYSIQLCEITSVKNGKAVDGNMEFYRSEIFRISKDSEDNDVDSGASCDSSLIDDAPALKMDRNEFTRLQNMINRYQYILHKDEAYKAALARLRSVETVGVAGLGQPLSLIAICTWAEVYIFDVPELGLDELKPILESEDIWKVLHGGAKLVSCLCDNYGVEMKNIFDTQIADRHLNHLNESRNLAQCTNSNLNFPLELLEPAMEHYLDHIYWNTRPIIKVGKIMAAQLVAYLITLHDYFQRLMLKDVFDRTKSDYLFVRDIDNLTMIQERLELVNHRA